MSHVLHAQRIPAHLPQRLTISFPIWGLYDTPGGMYHDLDRFVREHVERGFNCIRLDDGAGLMHDLNGNPRRPVLLGAMFGGHERLMRQSGVIGDGGYCDTLERLIALCAACKRHGVYVILSSWYYLHTFWMVHDKALNDELFSIPPHERFDAFARFLHYILLELEKRDLDSVVAFAEILNEADGLPFIDGYNKGLLTPEEKHVFRDEHAQSIAWLRAQHPQILFAFDSYHADTDPHQIPQTLQVFNFHHYFLWSIYTRQFDKSDMPALCRRENLITREDIVKTREGHYPAAEDWYDRYFVYANLDPEKAPLADAWLTERFLTQYDEFDALVTQRLKALLAHAQNHFPDVPLVCGEGVSYPGAYALLWEERCPQYWKLLESTARKYREAGLWGTVVRTCAGPEDPSWTMCASELRRVNEIFLGKRDE